MGVEMPSCHLKQIVTAIPMAHAVVLAERWFKALSDDVSVFTSLYRWLVETRHVAPAGLHDRTYAGAGAARRLLAAERARIARRTKLRGAALDRAVNLSDLNAGPQTLFAERRLLDDALVVVPDDDGEVQRVIREMLQDDSVAQTRKARSIASGADFGQWLASNAPSAEKQAKTMEIAHVSGNRSSLTVCSGGNVPQHRTVAIRRFRGDLGRA
ncbi:hypothetical protein [Sorangium sp. So ce341]|uniref:hypothetical protein n=1 Tax=Sorangium sp. So ce341 TaxID=3133302 RepID=UPI003F6322EF